MEFTGERVRLTKLGIDPNFTGSNSDVRILDMSST
jgi:hypothetical protein